jgi:hypothetical protein
MRTATVTIKGVSPYSQSRAHEAPKLDGEKPDAWEQRTWREKCHALDDGRIFIPPMSFKLGLDAAAKMNGDKIKGKGNATYTKFFTSGVLVVEPLVLSALKSEVQFDRIHCNADGVRGSGKRVYRMFPRIDDWGGDVQFFVLAPEIEASVFEKYIDYMGKVVGLGRFRPQNGGFLGRFAVQNVAWS